MRAFSFHKTLKILPAITTLHYFSRKYQKAMKTQLFKGIALTIFISGIASLVWISSQSNSKVENFTTSNDSPNSIEVSPDTIQTDTTKNIASDTIKPPNAQTDMVKKNVPTKNEQTEKSPIEEKFLMSTSKSAVIPTTIVIPKEDQNPSKIAIDSTAKKQKSVQQKNAPPAAQEQKKK